MSPLKHLGASCINLDQSQPQTGLKATICNFNETRNETKRCTLISRSKQQFQRNWVIFRGDNVLWFSLCCSTTDLSVCSPLFSEDVSNNYLLLQLQLQLRCAGSRHVAFRNACESQSSDRAVEGHQSGKPVDIFSIRYDPVSLKLLLCAMYQRTLLNFVFLSCGLW